MYQYRYNPLFSQVCINPDTTLFIGKYVSIKIHPSLFSSMYQSTYNPLCILKYVLIQTSLCILKYVSIQIQLSLYSQVWNNPDTTLSNSILSTESIRIRIQLSIFWYYRLRLNCPIIRLGDYNLIYIQDMGINTIFITYTKLFIKFQKFFKFWFRLSNEELRVQNKVEKYYFKWKRKK